MLVNNYLISLIKFYDFGAQLSEIQLMLVLHSFHIIIYVPLSPVRFKVAYRFEAPYRIAHNSHKTYWFKVKIRWLFFIVQFHHAFFSGNIDLLGRGQEPVPRSTALPLFVLVSRCC